MERETLPAAESFFLSLIFVGALDKVHARHSSFTSLQVARLRELSEFPFWQQRMLAYRIAQKW
jgi:hypothetical protein